MIVVIDPGHGGTSPAGRSSPLGARGTEGTVEKDVTLALAHGVAQRLGGGVVLTRDGDWNLSLGERIEAARRAGASVFLSLHANTGAPGQRGTEAWVHLRAGRSSRALAADLTSELARLGGPPAAEPRAAELAVLTPERHRPDTAACLLEVDYLSDPEGERRLRDPRSLDVLAGAIARAVARYRGAAGARPALAHAADTAPTSPHPLVTRIFDLVDASSLVGYDWKDRGQAPIGYLRGMALTYARVYCKYTLRPDEPENWRDRFAVEMARGVRSDASTQTDAVARYAAKFVRFGGDVSSDGVDVLRGLFTILFGLGMRESDGKCCTGWDRGKLNGWGDPSKAVTPTATNSEAGLFQLSYDIGVGAGTFKDLYDRYRQRPGSGFLRVFSEGVTCSAADRENFGTGVGHDFQEFSKQCPAFTVELAALALRTRANHWGPINVNTVEILKSCWDLLAAVETAVVDLDGCIAVD